VQELLVIKMKKVTRDFIREEGNYVPTMRKDKRIKLKF
jgi:hypothetical protein